MRRVIAPFLLGLGVMNNESGHAQSTPPLGIEEVFFETDDGVTVFGDLYRASDDNDRTLILLLHQSASNSAEYYPIAPGLVALGYHCVALDARGGGNVRVVFTGCGVRAQGFQRRALLGGASPDSHLHDVG